MAEAGTWEPVPRTRTYELVLARIEEQILAGALRVGDRLPPERELVELLGVSRAAIREALRVLEAQGVLRSRVGTGPDSGSVIAAMPGAALGQVLRLHMALANFPVGDVFETRAALERSSARLAAAQATEEDLARLREPLLRMDDPDLPRERFNDYDTDFHVMLAEAGGNRLMADMTIAVRSAARHVILKAFHRQDEWEPIVCRLRAEHHAIYDAVAAGDADRAGELVEAHVRGFRRVIAEQEEESDRGGSQA
ncbi:FadR family transcriptional regulator [Streptomyces sp. NA02950]|uniref:FadR/GntR family transcriptional regulator n=1 Tax=Streptomyces sp. NA02950 TaxID=2742137 RepID=UPI0015912B6A|nr:FadR/GntR family transcriptional regulator [Streptomyces sp. NA02950]QKV96224.1 FadR family transcriptional regulator [Streptomyces sp. NA02950]